MFVIHLPPLGIHWWIKIFLDNWLVSKGGFLIFDTPYWVLVTTDLDFRFWKAKLIPYQWEALQLYWVMVQWNQARRGIFERIGFIWSEKQKQRKKKDRESSSSIQPGQQRFLCSLKHGEISAGQNGYMMACWWQDKSRWEREKKIWTRCRTSIMKTHQMRFSLTRLQPHIIV
jgi:hypothetical protein